MTNEIKEILDNWKYVINNRITVYGEEIGFKQIELLLDYITNLQEENKKLKKAVKEKVIATCNTCEWYGVCPHSYKEYDYKTQIDKAVEYINKHEYQKYCSSPYEKDKYIMREEKEGQDLLNILRGDE